MMTVYVVNSLAWALMGLLLGYLVVRSATHLEEVTTAMSPASPPPDPAAPDPESTRPPRTVWWARFPRPAADRVIGAVVVILAIVSVAVMAVSVSAQQAAIERAERSLACQTQFNEAYAAALTERTEAARVERAAQRDLLTNTRSEDPAALDAAISRYLAQLAEADQRRAANPYPADPDCRE